MHGHVLAITRGLLMSVREFVVSEKKMENFCHNILQIFFLQELEPTFWQQLCSYVFPGINLTDL